MPGQPVRRGSMAHEHDAYTLLADIAAQQRDLAALHKYAPPAEELAERDGHRLYLAIARRALGVAGRLEGPAVQAEAGASLNQALEAFQSLGASWQAGRTLLELAELALARSDKPAAREHLNQALTLFEAMRAVPDAARTRTSLHLLG